MTPNMVFRRACDPKKMFLSILCVFYQNIWGGHHVTHESDQYTNILVSDEQIQADFIDQWVTLTASQPCPLHKRMLLRITLCRSGNTPSWTLIPSWIWMVAQNRINIWFCHLVSHGEANLVSTWPNIIQECLLTVWPPLPL
jgi:hypothetical protein